MDNDDFVTQSECAGRVKGLSTEIGKQSLALFGEDGRGGMQRDITRILTMLEDGGVKSTLSKSDKVTIALITALGSIVVALIANGVFG